jgi:hypothetical protein
MVCFRCISVNNLHKGDDDDDDYNNNKLVIIWATRIISKSFGKYLNNIEESTKKELQKTAILGTAHMRYIGKY